MESFGEYLRSAREQKGKTLEELAESTKIALPNLESLERDRYDLLPPRVFVKGFVRSYCQELGLDQQEVIRRFEEFTRGNEPVVSPEEERVVFNKAPHAIISNPWFTIVFTAAGFVSFCILALTGFTRLVMTEGPGKRATEIITQSSGPKAMPRSPEPAPEPAPRESARTQGRKILEIKAVGSAWVRVEADSGPAEELVMSPGEVFSFKARDGFHVQTGNAGGIRIRFDGKDLPPLGKMNQSLSVTLP
jgi:cytoskeletal protein RodZ